MRKFTNNITYLLLPVLIITFLCTGCSKEKASYIVSINNEKLSMDDFLYDIYLVEKEGNQLEDYYQEKFGSSYWDFDYNGTTAREAAKSSVITSVVMYDILSDRAEKNGIRLTREELSADEKTVNDILENYSKEAADRIGFTYDALKKAVDKRTLGDKYRTQLSKNFRIDEASVREDLNSSDYREYKTQCLYIPTFSIKDKEIIQFSEEEKAAALATITEALGELTEGIDFAVIKDSYPDLIYDTRDFVKGDPDIEQEYQTAAVSLPVNEFSKVVETKYGYYIIRMLDNNSSDRYEQAVREAMKTKEEDQFAEAYKEIKDQYDITINSDYWDTLQIGRITAADNTH